jgi:molybdate transport system substrate-binding protein
MTKNIGRYLRAVLAVLALLPAAAPAAAQQQRPLLVFAAASLTNVLPEIGRRYEATTGRKVTFSFAASMTLAKQIESSRGADFFVSADADSMDYLAQRGLLLAGSRRDILRNRLVLIAPGDSNIAMTIAPKFPLARALGNGRLAVANTMTVPAGRYARAALTALGVWDSVSNRLAEGEDVRATLAYVARGETPLGIVYATDARVEPKVKVVGTFPENTHPPIIYPVAQLKDGRADAGGFAAYLSTPPARAIFEKAGFSTVTASNP